MTVCVCVWGGACVWVYLLCFVFKIYVLNHFLWSKSGDVGGEGYRIGIIGVSGRKRF